jgi:hypothetical protein
MKKYILLFLMLVYSLQAGQQIVTQDPSTNTGKMRVTGIAIVTNTIVTTNSVLAHAVVGTQTNTTTAGTVIKTAAGGGIDTSFTSLFGAPATVLTTNFFTGHTGAAAQVYTQVGTITTTITNGIVLIRGSALQSASGNSMYIRVRDSNTNVVANTSLKAASGLGNVLQCHLNDTLTTATKTYALDVASDGVSIVYTNSLAETGSNPFITNALGITIIQIGRQ